MPRWTRLLQRGPGPPADDPPPPRLAISHDKLALLLTDYTQRLERAHLWAAGLATAGPLWISIIVGDFAFQDSRLGLDGAQWQVVFLLAATFFTLRGLWGLRQYAHRPRVTDVLAAVVSSAEITREHRAVFVIKRRGQDRDYRLLVFRDPLWDCYLLPHYNVVDAAIAENDDPVLVTFIAGFIGVPAQDVSVALVPGIAMTSRKHSEFYRMETLYRFDFYVVQIAGRRVPQHILEDAFTHTGRQLHWLTLPEMEADENTRRRNLDMTRYIQDHARTLLAVPPDTIVTDNDDH